MATLRARRAQRLLHGVTRDRILDVGCGHFPFFLTRSDFSRRFGVDREPGPGWTDLSGVRLSVADITRALPFREASFDAVTMLAVVEHIDAATFDPLLAEVRRVLTEGGRLVLTTPPPWSDPVLRVLARLGLASKTELEEHQVTYTPRRLREALERAGFVRVRAGVFELGLNAWASGDKGDLWSHEEEAPAATKKRSILGLLPTFLVVLGTVMLLIRERESFGRALELMGDSPSPLWLAALAVLVAGRGVLAGASYVVANMQLARAPASAAAFAWLRASITKYVPGVIWYPVTAVDRLRRFGVSGRAAGLAFYVDAVGSIAAAVLIGAIAVPTLIAEESGAAVWLFLAVPVVISLHPRVFAEGVRAIGRITSRPVGDVTLGWGMVGSVVGLHIGSWLLAGLSLHIVLRVIGDEVSLPLLFAATSISWATGLLAVPVPAGLGVREAVLVTLLVTEIPASTALAAALASRVLFVAVDVLALAASFPAARSAMTSGTPSTTRRLAP